MWPFSDEDESEDVQLFSAVKDEIMSRAPDLESGLDLFKEIYQESSFQDPAKGKELFASYSDDIRKSFGDTKPYNEDETLMFAPIDFADIVPNGNTPEEMDLNHINEWEQQNLKELGETDDPTYLQNKSKLERGIKQYASYQRREHYGKDNYWVSDMGLRAAQAALDPLAKLPGVAEAGGDSISNWFVENTDPDGATIPGLGIQVGGDEGYTSAIAGAVGSMGGAVASGALTTYTTGSPWGAYAYLGAAGLGAVADQYRESKEALGTEGEALTAAGIEGGSQFVQALVGGKIAGRAAKRLFGKQLVERFGTKVSTQVIGSGLVEGTTETAGQVASNFAENLGQNKNDSLLKGTLQSFVGGFFGGSGAEVFGHVRDSYKENPMADIPAPVNETEDLKQAIRDNQGSSPPKPESAAAERSTVKVSENATPLWDLEDGSQLVKDGELLHLRTPDGQALEAYEHNFSVDDKEWERVADALTTPTEFNDGTEKSLVAEDGKLYIESLDPTKGTPVREEVKTHPAGTPGMYPVAASSTRLETTQAVRSDPETGEQIVTNQSIKRKNPGFVGVSKIKGQSAGAASVFDLFQGQGWSESAKNLAQRLGPEISDAVGLTATQGETDAEGNTTLKTRLSSILSAYTKRSNKEGYSKAEETLASSSIGAELAKLDNKTSLEPDDMNMLNTILFKLQEAKSSAGKAKDMGAVDALDSLLDVASALRVKAGVKGGQFLESLKVPDHLIGSNEAISIENSFHKRARKRLDAEVGEGATVESLEAEVKASEEEVASLTKEVGDPVAEKLSELNSSIEKIDSKYTKPDEDARAQYTKEIEQLESDKQQIIEGQEGLKQEVLKNTQSEITATQNEIQKIEDSISAVESTPVAPSKTLDNKVNDLQESLDRHQQREARLTKEIEELEKEGSKPKTLAKAKENLENTKKAIESTREKLNEHKDKQEARANTTKTASSDSAKRLAKLRGRLKELQKAYTDAANVNPANASRLKDLDKRINQRKARIADLDAKKGKPAKMSDRDSKRKIKLVTERDELVNQSKAGKITIKGEAVDKLSQAKIRRDRAVEKLTLAKAITDSELAKIPHKDLDQLKNLYNVRGTLDPKTQSEEIYQVDKVIFDIRAKYLDPTDGRALKSLYNYWRANILSGPDTIARNAWANAGLGIIYPVGLVVSGKPGMSLYYLKGYTTGLIQTLPEAKEIIRGRREGRNKYDIDRELGKLTPKFSNALLNAGAKGLDKTTWPVRVSLAVQSATDVLAYRAASQGQANLAAYIISKRQGLKGHALKVAVENQMFNTDAHYETVLKEVEARARTLKQAGVTMSEAAKKIAVYRSMEARRAQVLQDIGDTHGLRAVVQQEPDGQLGALYRAITSLATDEDATVRFKWKGRDQAVGFFKWMFPFARTGVNVTNAYLDVMPVLGHYRGLMAENAINKRYGKTAEERQKNISELTPKQEENRQLEIEMLRREHMAKANLGLVVMGSLFSWAMACKDDDDPYFAIYGAVPKGQEQVWRELGRRPYTIKIGNTNIGTQYTPFAIVTALLGGAMESVKKGADPVHVAMNASMSAIGAVAELSLFGELGELFRTLQNISAPSAEDSTYKEARMGNLVKSAIGSFAQGFVPNSGLLRNIARWSEQSPKETYNNLSAKMAQLLPFSESLGVTKPMLNIFGEPVKKDIFDRTAIGSFFSWEDTDPVFLWMANTGYTVSNPGPVLKLLKGEQLDYGAKQQRRYGYSDILSPEQTREVLEISGPKIKRDLAKLMRQPEFKVFSKKNQEQINKIVNNHRADAKAKVLR